MAVLRLVCVNVEPGCSSPLSADIPDRFEHEVSIARGTREDNLFRIAAAKTLKQFGRRYEYANSASLCPLPKDVDLAYVIDSLNVFPAHSRDF